MVRGRPRATRPPGIAAHSGVPPDLRGGYTLIALRPIAYLEPYAQYDLTKVTVREQRLLCGFAVYPFPHERATKNLRLKSEAGFDWQQGEKRRFIWFFQLTTGF